MAACYANQRPHIPPPLESLLPAGIRDATLPHEIHDRLHLPAHQNAG